MDALGDAERQLIERTLGLDHSKQSCRNYLCADKCHDDMPIINSLVAFGFMREAFKVNQDRTAVYYVTPEGQAALKKGRWKRALQWRPG